jgi:trimethylamine--corrinoid protein Co-methyltransferase
MMAENPNNNLLDLDLLDQVHADALQVLEQVGVRCESAEIRQIFEDTGLAAFDTTTGHLLVYG